MLKYFLVSFDPKFCIRQADRLCEDHGLDHLVLFVIFRPFLYGLQYSQRSPVSVRVKNEIFSVCDLRALLLKITDKWQKRLGFLCQALFAYIFRLVENAKARPPGADSGEITPKEAPKVFFFAKIKKISKK